MIFYTNMTAGMQSVVPDIVSVSELLTFLATVLLSPGPTSFIDPSKYVLHMRVCTCTCMKTLIK